LRSRFYSGYTHTPRTSYVLATFDSKNQTSRHPLVDLHFESHRYQPYTHDVFVHLISGPSKIKTTFRVFFKKSIRLPVNPVLGIQGDLVVMRAASKHCNSVVNMRGRPDYRLADFIVQQSELFLACNAVIFS
ncbi:MAG: hypothetical protein NXY57DRAFT_891827, partial [Lentinula lateritia]